MKQNRNILLTGILLVTTSLFIVTCVDDKGTDPEEPETTVTDIDGNVYQTVTIGGQVWMAENLKVTHYNNGDSIENVTDSLTWHNLEIGGYSYYNNDSASAQTYGCLYNWYAVSDERGVAPNGWHVPDGKELSNLIDYLGGRDIAGGKMKEAGVSHWSAPNEGATNESGFSALPAGIRPHAFLHIGSLGVFWTGSTCGEDHAWTRYLSFDTSGVLTVGYPKFMGCSVRCIKD